MSLTIVEGRAYPLGLANIDTDMIVSSDWLKTTTKAGLAVAAFQEMREVPGNVFDNPAYAGAQILIAGANFGCGSSREHAAWALADFGVRVVIAPSFSDIFSSNAFKNGILTAVVPAEAIPTLMDAAKRGEIKVDLEAQAVIMPSGASWPITIDPFRRRCLIEGLDEIALSLAQRDGIEAYEAKVADEQPWLAGNRAA